MSIDLLTGGGKTVAGEGKRWQEPFSCVMAWNVRFLVLRRLGLHHEEY
jgi:hypothetical protein